MINNDATINNDNDAIIIQRIINQNCLHPQYAAALKKALMDYFRNNGDNNFNANNRVEDNDLNVNNQNVGNFTTTEVASLNTSDATLPLAGEAAHPTE
ncbi:MAG: hypothetical protein ACJBCI_02640 [Candidatus Tisiphia sp.]|jgi:hypothetical protein|uniref:hypothetical protein n=1 Tax=Candidatus Tisiphia endosymbiont of Melanophora roralis TaxID=3066261 RepID=UPI001E7DACB9|nr:MAG: hypothetical protein LF884_01700 [Rickettsia endosymbiont of Cimex lectularius]